jgi:ABC-type uncharacterized transport system ATPase component
LKLARGPERRSPEAERAGAIAECFDRARDTAELQLRVHEGLNVARDRAERRAVVAEAVGESRRRKRAAQQDGSGSLP